MEDRYLSKAKTVTDGTWVQGYYVYDYGRDIHYIFANEIACPNCINDRRRDFSLQDYEVDPSTICQCTGLKDKNGKLIFENDIVDRKEPYPEIVKYNDGDWTLDYSYACNMETGRNYCNLGFYVLERKCVDVIGNIFDNKELLESEG